jgi:phage terminase Nu1 subunit (DNA packaging protein)
MLWMCAKALNFRLIEPSGPFCLLFLFKGLWVTDLRSLADTAAFFEVSQPTVRRWIDAGCPVAERGSNGIAYKLDLTAVAAWRQGQRQAETEAEQARLDRDAQLRLQLLGPAALTAQADAPALSPSQRAAALAEEVYRTKLAQLRGELVQAELMKLRGAEYLSLFRARLRQLPDLLGSELALTEHQVLRIADLVDDMLHETCDALEALPTDAALA